jgi:hypothetical protein
VASKKKILYADKIKNQDLETFFGVTDEEGETPP